VQHLGGVLARAQVAPSQWWWWWWSKTQPFE
jgi:hypothetical protein